MGYICIMGMRYSLKELEKTNKSLEDSLAKFRSVEIKRIKFEFLFKIKKHHNLVIVTINEEDFEEYNIYLNECLKYFRGMQLTEDLGLNEN